MLKRMSVVICGLAVMLLTAGPAIAQGDAAADAATTAAVKTKLLADTKVGGLKIDVDTKDNVVTLTGKVHSAAERTEAVRLARTTTRRQERRQQAGGRPERQGTTDQGRQGDRRQEPRTRPRTAAEKTQDDAIKRARRRPARAAEKAGDATKDAAVKTKDVDGRRHDHVGGEDEAARRHEGRRPEDQRRHQGQRRHADRHGATAPRRRTKRSASRRRRRA